MENATFENIIHIYIWSSLLCE